MALGERTVSADGLGELLAVPRAGAVALTSGYLSEDLQPLPQLAASMGRASRRPGAWGRAPIEGSEQLRGWFAREAGGGFGAHGPGPSFLRVDAGRDTDISAAPCSAVSE